MCYEYRPLYIYCDSGTGEINGTFPKSIRKSPFLLVYMVSQCMAGACSRRKVPEFGEFCSRRKVHPFTVDIERHCTCHA